MCVLGNIRLSKTRASDFRSTSLWVMCVRSCFLITISDDLLSRVFMFCEMKIRFTGQPITIACGCSVDRSLISVSSFVVLNVWKSVVRAWVFMIIFVLLKISRVIKITGVIARITTF